VAQNGKSFLAGFKRCVFCACQSDGQASKGNSLKAPSQRSNVFWHFGGNSAKGPNFEKGNVGLKKGHKTLRI
jgi:hypothetical protein